MSKKRERKKIKQKKNPKLISVINLRSPKKRRGKETNNGGL